MNHEIIFGVPLFRYHLDPSEIKRDAEEKFKASQGFPIDERLVGGTALLEVTLIIV